MLFIDPAVHFKGSDGGNNDDGIRGKSALAAFDVQELLRAEVKGESGLRYGIIGTGQGHFRGNDGVAAVCYVGKRSSVHKCRHAFQ